MIKLSVNLNKVALLRNAREGDTPSVLAAARAVIAAGAHGITVHPRPDQRHIRASDVPALAQLLADEFPQIEFNIEGNPAAGPRANGYPGFTALVEQARPTQCTLVPDTDNQRTSDHGFDLRGNIKALQAQITHYQQVGCRVSLFMDPDLSQIQRVPDTGANRIELYTGPFAAVVARYGQDSAQAAATFAQYAAAAELAAKLGLGVNAGHDLDLNNLPLFTRIPELQEVSIGHALTADALTMGWTATVAAYLAACTPQ